jgi:asparagine synthase (glutamine-hydrolysing)
MTGLVCHRGPDDEGYVLVDRVTGELSSYCGKDSTPETKALYPFLPDEGHGSLGLGFRRLTILELSQAGHQPMVEEDLGLCLTFNGEIYNYLELMEELKSAGYFFRGHSDAEVILKAYDHWGEDCLRRFTGMWAFALWDQRRQRLFASRDRYGIKPFYYAATAEALYWGSELKQLLLTPADASLNLPMVWRSMKINSLLVYDDQTFFSGIRTLKPGHSLVLEGGRLELKQYYSLDVASFESCRLGFAQATERYRELFEDSLRLHLRSDVEIAASLSGGMDSSAIVCGAFRHRGGGMQTFSTYYEDDPSLDERRWIRLIAEQTDGLSHYLSPSAEDARLWLEDVTWFNDLPTRAGYTSQWAVMKAAAASGIKVLLSGQGSDELSAGYKHSAYRFFADLLRSFKLAGFSRQLKPYLEDAAWGERLARLGKIGLSALLPESALYRLEFRHYRFEPFNREFTSAARAASTEGILERIHDIPSSRLLNFLYNMLHSTSIQTLLHLEDRMSSANSVESRVPFLDHRLVDFSFTLPSSFKIKPPMHKYIHREAMKDIVPLQIYERRDKAVFSSPFFSAWMKGALRPFFEGILHSDEFRGRGVWNLPLVHAKWRSYLAGDPAPAEMLFNVVAQEVWFRRFAGGKGKIL